jgi:superfamily I DNA/RNA helicase
MAWLIPYNKLDEQQKNFIDNIDINQKNIWIKGFPGSGKSVLLAHTIRKIRNATPNARLVFVVFTQSLKSLFDAAFREMGQHVPILTFYEFMDSGEVYDYVLSDEVQDMTPSVLRTMNNRSKHVVVAGDSNQSIYTRDPKYREDTVTPSQISMLLGARDYELGIIHRLSSSIINVIEKFLPRMNIFTAKRDLTKQSTQVRLCEAHNQGEEVKYIMREAQKAINVGDTAAILIPTHEDIINFINLALKDAGKATWSPSVNRWGKTDWGALNAHLRQQRMSMQYVGNSYGSFSEDSNKITVMTYHSAKGLDFDNVFIPGLNNNLFIVSDETLSKTLFMVAMTRSRNNLYLTYCGYAHNYLNAFRNDCHYIDIHDNLRGASNTKTTGNVFGI